jgi:hypothetical protein
LTVKEGRQCKRRENNIIVEWKGDRGGRGGPGGGKKDKVKREERHQKEKVFWNVTEDIATVR